MATLNLRNLDEQTARTLRAEAARRGWTHSEYVAHLVQLHMRFLALAGAEPGTKAVKPLTKEITKELAALGLLVGENGQK